MRGRKEEKRCEEETTINEGCVEPSRDRSHRGNCWLMALLLYDLRREAFVGSAANNARFSKNHNRRFFEVFSSLVISCDFARLAALYSNNTSQESLHLCREVTLHQTGGLWLRRAVQHPPLISKQCFRPNFCQSLCWANAGKVWSAAPLLWLNRTFVFPAFLHHITAREEKHTYRFYIFSCLSSTIKHPFPEWMMNNFAFSKEHPSISYQI